jgi:hypothetical protein
VSCHGNVGAGENPRLVNEPGPEHRRRVAPRWSRECRHVGLHANQSSRDQTLKRNSITSPSTPS